MKTTVDTNYTAPFTPNGNQTVVTFSKDVKFTPGNIAQCNLSTISTVPEATAQQSVVPARSVPVARSSRARPVRPR